MSTIHKKPSKMKGVKAWALTVNGDTGFNRMAVKHYGINTSVYAIFYTKKEAEWWNDGSNKVFRVLITPL